VRRNLGSEPYSTSAALNIPGLPALTFKLLPGDRARLSGLPASHVWPFQEWLETDRACYLIRQYVFSNLYHRLSMRPFMSHIEKVCAVGPRSPLLCRFVQMRKLSEFILYSILTVSPCSLNDTVALTQCIPATLAAQLQKLS
jgi:hypothetical protein